MDQGGKIGVHARAVARPTGWVLGRSVRIWAPRVQALAVIRNHGIMCIFPNV
jgi:hypothetical protein